MMIKSRNSSKHLLWSSILISVVTRGLKIAGIRLNSHIKLWMILIRGRSIWGSCVRPERELSSNVRKRIKKEWKVVNCPCQNPPSRSNITRPVSKFSKTSSRKKNTSPNYSNRPLTAKWNNCRLKRLLSNLEYWPRRSGNEAERKGWAIGDNSATRSMW